MLVVKEEDGGFLSRSSVSAEYPDAEKFSRVSHAEKFTRENACPGKWEIIRNYGMVTEEIVRVVSISAGWE